MAFWGKRYHYFRKHPVDGKTYCTWDVSLSSIMGKTYLSLNWWVYRISEVSGCPSFFFCCLQGCWHRTNCKGSMNTSRNPSISLRRKTSRFRFVEKKKKVMLSTIPSASWKERPTTKTYQNNLRKSCGICLVQLVQKLGMVQSTSLVGLLNPQHCPLLRPFDGAKWMFPKIVVPPNHPF